MSIGDSATADRALATGFRVLTARPRLALGLSLLMIVLTGSGLTRLAKDTSVTAFIPAGHPSLAADERVTDVFGISDTVAVAVATSDGRSVFESQTLALVVELTDVITGIENVRSERVASLATESWIAGDDDELEIAPYIDPFDITAASAEEARQRWLAMPPHRNTLVADDESAAMIIAELIDADLAADTYEAVLALTADYEMAGLEIHVAGPGAVSGYLSRYIDQDARKLQPLVFLLVLGFIYLAFRRFRALPAPLLVVVGSAPGALGVMGWAGVSYFAITSALPVIIVAISVADAIHILSSYYQLRESSPELDRREIVVRAMTDMARPITLTTITTIAGFAGIATVSIMPPITWFAIFASLGVALAWLFSMSSLPNVLLIVDPGRSPAFFTWSEHRPSGLGRWLVRVGAVSPLRYGRVLILFVITSLIAAFGAKQLRIDRSQVENFAANEPVRIADELMNERFAGTAFLDIIIETNATEGLLSADRMRKIRELQSFFESLPHVRKTVSIVDYLAALDRALTDTNGGELRQLPGADADIEQYIFVYEISGDPTDLEEEIDADYQTALVRGVLDARYFSQTRGTLEALDGYLRTEFNEPGITGVLAGDVNVGYHWMQSLRLSHFEGVALSLALVFIASALVFRSLITGLISVVPVAFTVLVLYACMGYLGIYLEPATSMFAAIALGVGVDFAIHLVDRLQKSLDQYEGNLAMAIDLALPPVARACFFNSAALALGFSVLMVSDLPTLTRFGGLVTLAAVSSYLCALLIVPALFALRSDWFSQSTGRLRRTGAAAMTIALLGMTAAPVDVAIAADDRALHVASMVAARKEGRVAKRRIKMTLTNKRGRQETRVALVHKQSDDDLRRTRVTFLEPKRSRDFAFLSHDGLTDDGGDDRWMYIPVQRKVRRIPASERGSSFFGTDFTYEDIQSELKFDLNDWNFEYVEELTDDGETQHRISGTPRSDQIARELGYGAFTAVIDEATWMPLEIEFLDRRERLLKTIEVRRFSNVDGIQTPLEVHANNHQTGHSTLFEFGDIEYPDELPDQLFEARSLNRGVRATED